MKKIILHNIYLPPKTSALALMIKNAASTKNIKEIIKKIEKDIPRFKANNNSINL